jgi:xylulokinase
MFADIFNVKIIRANVDQEAGSLGAAALGAVGAGLWKDFSPIDGIIKTEEIVAPDLETARLYAEIIPIFERSLEFQAEIGDAMAELRGRRD